MDLATLKVGDTAYIMLGRGAWGLAARVRSATVTKISATGQVTVDLIDGKTAEKRRFSKHGWQIGSGPYHGARLIEFDEYERLRIAGAGDEARTALRYRIQQLERRKLTDKAATVQAIREALEYAEANLPEDTVDGG